MAIPAPTHIEPHVERVTLQPGGHRAPRDVCSWSRPGRPRRRSSPTSSAPTRDPRRWPAQLARDARRDLDPRRGRGRRARRRLTRIDAEPSPAATLRGDQPDRVVRSPDGTSIAVFTVGVGPPLILVHGTSRATTRRSGSSGRGWRATSTVHAIDRRGRGASGDTRALRDRARVRGRGRGRRGRRRGRRRSRSTSSGTRYGGRCALGAALRTDAIGRVICYEGAPDAARRHVPARPASTPSCARSSPPATGRRSRDVHDAGRRHAASRAGRLPGGPGLAASAWPRPPTIVRELEAERDPAAVARRPRRVRQPVLQLLGGESLPVFREATAAPRRPPAERPRRR